MRPKGFAGRFPEAEASARDVEPESVAKAAKIRFTGDPQVGHFSRAGSLKDCRVSKEQQEAAEAFKAFG